jgi:hypothetical protein
MELTTRTYGIGWLLWLMCVLCALTVPVLAQADGNNTRGTAYVNPTNMFPNVKDIDSDTKLQEKLNQYLNKRGWKLGVSSDNPDNAWIGWGSALIKVEPDDIRFGEARIAAFHRAFASAKGNFALSRMVKATTEITAEFMRDRLPDDKPIQDKLAFIRERLSIAAEKGIDLGEAYLDKLLRDVGIDPADYRKAGPVRGKQMLKDAIAVKVVSESVSSMRGLHILTTFEDLKAIGVLVIHSDSSEEIARQCVLGQVVSRRPVEAVTASIQDVLAKTFPGDADYTPVHGVRIMQDDAGQNVLVAFGQWAPPITKTTSSRLAQADIRAAREMARQEALGALTDFANSQLQLKVSSEGKELEDISRVTLGTSLQDVESYDIGSRIESVIKQNGRANWEGVTTVKTWTANNPRTGHVLVGHVLMWSPSTRDAARGNFLKPDGARPAGQVKYDDEVIEAPALDHLDPTLRR